MSRVETIGDATLYLGDCRDVLGDVPGPVSFVFACANRRAAMTLINHRFQKEHSDG